MDEADMAVAGFGCTYGRMEVVHCPPAISYQPFYFFTRYPLETTKLWNLFKLLTPTSWIWTFASIISSVAMLKLLTFVGVNLGCGTSVQDVTLVPFR